jgi:hypothetical protein
MKTNVGWYDDLGSTDFHSEGYLIGVKVVLPADALLSRIGIIVRSDAAGHNVQMAVYSDGGSGPSKLMAATSGETLIGGRNELRPTSTPILPAGGYWIMSVFDRETNVGHDTATGETWRYLPFSYGNSLPPTITTSMQTPFVAHINHYLVVF